MSERRDRLRGRCFEVAPGVRAEIRRSCRNELKILYQAEHFSSAQWESFEVLGQASYLRASKLNPQMKDLGRVVGEGLLLEGPVEGQLLVAIYRGAGKLRARRQLEILLGRRAPLKVGAASSA